MSWQNVIKAGSAVDPDKSVHCNMAIHRVSNCLLLIVFSHIIVSRKGTDSFESAVCCNVVVNMAVNMVAHFFF